VDIRFGLKSIPDTSLSDDIVATAILDGGASVGKRDLVEQLLERIAAAGHIATESIPEICKTIMRRESLGSTGIGNGIALPHGRHESLTRPLAILAKCKSPVDFESIDGESVDLFVLILSPRDPSPQMVRQSQRWSERLLRSLMNREFVASLRSAATVEDQWNSLQKGSDFSTE
jgi:mannitol/fructose-specific phosphotransferase system IIA component (Ntr-type)